MVIHGIMLLFIQVTKIKSKMRRQQGIFGANARTKSGALSKFHQSKLEGKEDRFLLAPAKRRRLSTQVAAAAIAAVPSAAAPGLAMTDGTRVQRSDLLSQPAASQSQALEASGSVGGMSIGDGRDGRTGTSGEENEGAGSGEAEGAVNRPGVLTGI